jgi:DNA-binding MarR family transcriptional regulator
MLFHSTLRKDLARNFAATLVVLVKQLEERDLVERRPHPRDGRALGLHLTPAGRRLVDEGTALAYTADQEATAGLSDDERQALAKLLRKIYPCGG